MFIISFSNIAFIVDGTKAAGRRRPNRNPNGKPQCGKKRTGPGGGGKPGRRRRYAVESRRRRQRPGKGNVFLLK